MAGAIGTSISSTLWYDNAGAARSEMVGRLNTDETVEKLTSSGWSLDQARAAVAQIVDKEAMALATNHIFMLAAIVFALAAFAVWLAPRPRRAVDTSAVH